MATNVPGTMGSIWKTGTLADATPAGALVVFFSGPVTHLRFTGAAAGGDTWSIL